MENCKHERFYSSVNITRLTDNKNKDIVTGYSADIKIHCSQCHQDFEFIGVPVGISFDKPMASFDLKELRVPIKPHLRIKDESEKYD